MKTEHVTTPLDKSKGFAQELNGTYPLAAVSRRLSPSLVAVTTSPSEYNTLKATRITS